MNTNSYGSAAANAVSIHARDDLTDERGQVVWKRHAGHWTLVGSPLRPCPDDSAIMKRMLENWIQRTGREHPTVLVLGMTPEVRATARAVGGRVVAVDWSVEMIRRWSDAAGTDKVICADWRALPLPPSSVDIIAGDGWLTQLGFPDGYVSAWTQLKRLLRGPGCCVIRCFVQADSQESVADVFAAMERDAIGNFHILKWRLAMAVQRSLSEGVAVGSIWNALHERWPDLAALAVRRAWRLAEVETIHAYRGAETRYTFPTWGECRTLFPMLGFRIEGVEFPQYELGERCPTLALVHG